MISDYGKIYTLGHRDITTLFDEPVWAEEKIDGSQFSFGLIEGQLRCRSRSRELSVENPDGLFANVVASLRTIEQELHPEWVYRGECLSKPKHNVLAYDRAPAKHVILFDIKRADGTLLTPDERDTEASRLGLESVPVLFSGKISSADEVKGLLETVSVLGGQKIEGLVFKRDNMKVKLVSDRFKEHQTGKKIAREPQKDLAVEVGEHYRATARFDKAVQHLREDGKITDSPADIGPLMRELARDLLDECGNEIKEKLFEAAKKQIVKTASNGFPQWYKEQLLKRQFEESEQ